jgi:hypothetical protein
MSGDGQAEMETGDAFCHAARAETYFRLRTLHEIALHSLPEELTQDIEVFH